MTTLSDQAIDQTIDRIDAEPEVPSPTTVEEPDTGTSGAPVIGIPPPLRGRHDGVSKTDIDNAAFLLRTLLRRVEALRGHAA
jgi:hypothetical protein